MIATVDKGHIGVFALLDLSAAFDTVDHVILMETLRSIRRIGLAYVGGDALGWLADYLNGRRQVVCVASSETDMPLQYGILQGSVLGPRIFIEYAELGRLRHFRPPRCNSITTCSPMTCRDSAVDHSTMLP